MSSTIVSWIMYSSNRKINPFKVIQDLSVFRKKKKESLCFITGPYLLPIWN